MILMISKNFFLHNLVNEDDESRILNDDLDGCFISKSITFLSGFLSALLLNYGYITLCIRSSAVPLKRASVNTQ